MHTVCIYLKFYRSQYFNPGLLAIYGMVCVQVFTSRAFFLEILSCSTFFLLPTQQLITNYSDDLWWVPAPFPPQKKHCLQVINLKYCNCYQFVQNIVLYHTDFSEIKQFLYIQIVGVFYFKTISSISPLGTSSRNGKSMEGILAWTLDYFLFTEGTGGGEQQHKS